jgi:hypothetical protein
MVKSGGLLLYCRNCYREKGANGFCINPGCSDGAAAIRIALEVKASQKAGDERGPVRPA